MTNFIGKNLTIQSWKDLEPYFEKLKTLSPKNETDFEDYIRHYSDLLSAYREADAWAYINMTRHTNHDDLLKRHQMFLTEIAPEVEKACHEIDQIIVNHPHFQKLPDTRYAQLKRELRRDIELYRDKNIPVQTELGQLNTQYNQIAGSLTVEWEGEDLPLPKVQKYLKSSDREVRKKAWLAIQEARRQKKKPLDDLFDKMIDLRDQLAKNTDYKNFRDYKHDALHRFDYTVQDTLKFHAAIQDCILPLYKEIETRHVEKLGLQKDYRPWDTKADLPGTRPLHPFQKGEELLEKTIRVFSKLRPEFAENLQKMKSANLFDLDSRKHKAPGGYNYGLEVTGMPFIFMNSAGTHRDVVTLMHEGGHAMHSFLVRSEPLIFYRNAPSEMAETASMTMELLTSPFWNEFYDEKEHRRAFREHLEDIISFFPWCATVDAFQHWIYTHPKHSQEERDRYFENCLKTYSTGLVDWSGYEDERRNSWQSQLHIFEVPFYYIEYGIAQLGALQIYRNFVTDPEKALADYISGLKLGSSKPLPEVWKTMNIRFDFSKTMIQDLMAFVKEELQRWAE